MSIYQHFRESEHSFIDQVLSWKEYVEQTFQSKLTDFLDPREQQIVEALIGATNAELQISFHGGGEATERKRAIIAPYYEEVSLATFQLVLMQATYQIKFVSLFHQDIMGSFLSLGIERKKLGDIFVADGILQIVMAREIAPYVEANLTKIKKTSITLEEKSFSDLLEKELNWIEADNTVSSLRLDVVLKEIYNISRKNAVEYIKKGHVKVNFKQVDDGAFLLLENDLISVRGKGRSKLVKINGRTKKEKCRITTATLHF